MCELYLSLKYTSLYIARGTYMGKFPLNRSIDAVIIRMLPNILDTKSVKRSTMFYIIQIIVFFLIVKYISCEDTDSCKGDLCRKSLAIPLLDNLNAPLVAKLDITQFNKQLQEYITEQIKQGVEQAKHEIRGEIKDLVETFEDTNVNGKLKSIFKSMSRIDCESLLANC